MTDVSKYDKVSIIGAAKSGIAAAKLLNRHGAKVLLSDSSPEEKINKGNLNEIRSLNIKYETGFHSDKIFDCDLMVVSPGVPQDSEVIQTASAKGILVVSEVEVASWFCKGKIIAITGTNGKTTTTTLIGEILKDAGYNAHVCGNIGVAFSDIVDKINRDDFAVVETSSFQLDNIKWFHPVVSVLLNITSDHLDRYGNNFESYIKSKMSIYNNQLSSDYFIFNVDDNVITENISSGCTVQKSAFSIKQDLSEKYNLSAYLNNNYLVYCRAGKTEELIHSNELMIKGMHNVYNSLASILAVKQFGVANNTIRTTLSNFKGVEHRLEYLREFKGVKFYNDSKATNVNSVWYALQGFTEPIILILGGKDKGNNYDEIRDVVRKYVKHIVAIGSSQEIVYEYFKDIIPTTKAFDMSDAVKQCVTHSQKGDVILLSPACASFDMFDNFEHRGEVFKQIVNSLN